MTLVQTTTTTREQSMLIPIPQVEPSVTIPAQNLRIPGDAQVLCRNRDTWLHLWDRNEHALFTCRCCSLYKRHVVCAPFSLHSPRQPGMALAHAPRECGSPSEGASRKR